MGIIKRDDESIVERADMTPIELWHANNLPDDFIFVRIGKGRYKMSTEKGFVELRFSSDDAPQGYVEYDVEKIGIPEEALRANREEVKKTIWGGGYYATGEKKAANYCVDCHGWKGSVPDYVWIKDPTSAKTVKCDECGKVSGGVRQEKP